jgi:glycosyltransferase involved in cell wall biosynthesis
MVEIILIVSLLLVCFAYFGYPASLYMFRVFIKKDVKKEEFFTEVTMIITAYNEEKRIKEKLDNTLALDYPHDNLHILVASDGSTDTTNEIIKDYEKSGIALLAIEHRGGKENAQKEAVQRANGEVIVFSDVATLLDPDGLKEIVSNFADASVGCVSSEDRLIDKDGKPSGEGFYVRYEMWLRRLESRVASLVGLSGSFFAARKDVCQDFSGEMQSDFRTVLNSIKMGLRGVSDPDAIGYYQDVSDEKREFDRKIRTVVRGLTVFFRNLEFLNPFQYGLFSYQCFCHKLLRWLVPLFLLIALVSNAILAAQSSVFFILLLGQILFYAAAFWGWRHENGDTNIFVKIPMYFVAVNASILVAWWRYLRGQRVVMWTPSER